MVARLCSYKNLCLVLEPAESAAVDHAVAVALKFSAVFRRRLSVNPPARPAALRRVCRQETRFSLF
jgi:hypothetical protein